MSDIQPGTPKKKRKGLIVLGIILAVLVVVIGGCAVLVAVVFSKSGDSVDQANNAKTGLVDGSYTMAPNVKIVLSDKCSFGGEVYDVDNAAMGSKTVVGAGEQCALGTDTSVVAFTVTGGEAEIISVR